MSAWSGVPPQIEAEGVPGFGRRRMLLALSTAAVVLPLAACTGTSGSPAPTGPTDTGTDDALRLEVASQELTLVRLYAAVLRAQPLLAPVLRVGVRHVDYGAAMKATGVAQAPPPIPAGRAAALTLLQRAEQAAAANRVHQCATATDPELARVLALIGAGCAGAAQVLRQATRG